MSDEDASEKEYEPTERRLQEARAKGEVAQGRDLVAAAAFGGLLLAWLAMGQTGPESMGTIGAILLDQADSLSTLVFAGGRPPIGGLRGALALALAPLFLLPFTLVIAMLIVQRAVVFAPSKLAPKLSRISPIQGAKTKFGRTGLFEFAKNTAKLIAVSLALGVFMAAKVDLVVKALYLPPAAAIVVLFRLLVEFLAVVLVLQVVIGVIDLIWQRADHLRKHRMSRKELMDELKQSDGDPQMKAQRRQRAVEIAGNRMLADVAKADVVIVNPTHYAVALTWDRATRGAPRCVAKGVDETAARIRARAAENGVPIRHDPPTARALFAIVEIGEEIPVDHYRAVAAAIRFSEAMRRKARARGFGRRP